MSKNILSSQRTLSQCASEHTEMEVIMYNVNISEKPQLMVGVDFVFMGVEMGASYHKTSTGYEILVAPSVLDNNVGLTIKEMVEQFNSLGGDKLSEDDVKSKIESENEVLADLNGVSWDSIRFILKMLFLNVKRNTADPSGDITEYAISLVVDCADLLPAQTVINIKSITFNVWNTQRQTILEKMSLISPASV